MTFSGLKPASFKASAAARGSSRKTDTKSELALRKALWHAGCRYRKNVSWLPGKPDIVLLGPRIAIFCDGDFWHGKDWPARRIKLARGHNADYWMTKIEGNMERDSRNTLTLEQAGWTVMRFWESEIQADLENIVNRVVLAMKHGLDS